MNLYKKKYRIKSTRLKGWDYSSTGYYFVTICTGNRQHFFGNILEEEMSLSEIENIASQYWVEIPEHFNHTGLDEFVIMPNHIHGIVIIENPVEMLHATSLQDTTAIQQKQPKHKNQYISNISPQKGSLGAIIHSYKSAVTQWWRKNGHTNFTWQSRFYDHIIRNETSLHKIREYIHYNPLKWETDKENPKNI